MIPRRTMLLGLGLVAATACWAAYHLGPWGRAAAPRRAAGTGTPAGAVRADATSRAPAAVADPAGEPPPVAEAAPAVSPGAAGGTGPAPAADGEREALLAENAQLRAQLDDLLNWILANFRGRYPVPDGLVGRLRIEGADAAYRLSPEVADFLRITPEEEERINAAFLYARSLVDLAEQQVMSVEMTAADAAVVHVPAFAEAGEAVRAWLTSTFEETLGPARSSRLADVSRDNLDERFAYFGAAERTIRFELAPGPAGPLLRIHDAWRLPDAEDPTRFRIAATERVVDGLPEEYVPYLTRLARTMEVTP